MSALFPFTNDKFVVLYLWYEPLKKREGEKKDKKKKDIKNLTFDCQLGFLFLPSERVLSAYGVLSLVLHLDSADLEFVLLAPVLLHVLVALGQRARLEEPETTRLILSHPLTLSLPKSQLCDS
jgi:hypothetical protein